MSALFSVAGSTAALELLELLEPAERVGAEGLIRPLSFCISSLRNSSLLSSSSSRPCFLFKRLASSSNCRNCFAILSCSAASCSLRELEPELLLPFCGDIPVGGAVTMSGGGGGGAGGGPPIVGPGAAMGLLKALTCAFNVPMRSNPSLMLASKVLIPSSPFKFSFCVFSSTDILVCNSLIA